MEQERWPQDWMRGALGVCVLRVLADGPTYGYAIAAALEQAGIAAVKGGTLYPLLTRLDAAGWVQVEWRAGDGGPGRKYYTLTPAGRDEQRRQARAWAEFASVTAAFVDDQANAAHDASAEQVSPRGNDLAPAGPAGGAR